MTGAISVDATAGDPPAAAVVALDRTPENRLAGANLAVGLVALFVGVLTGLFQALEHAGINVYPALDPVVRSYYHGLSMHGVLNVLVFTTFFNVGFLQLIAGRAFGIQLASMRLGWFTFWLMLGGLVLAAVPLVGNDATVMFTFYPPLKAPWTFFVGLTVVVIGTWLVTLNLVQTYRTWRRANPQAITPLAGYMSLVTFVMWSIASLGLAAEMLTRGVAPARARVRRVGDGPLVPRRRGARPVVGLGVVRDGAHPAHLRADAAAPVDGDAAGRPGAARLVGG